MQNQSIVSDQSAIQALVARFDDAVNRRDLEEFRPLWSKDGVWEIGHPMPMRVEGAEVIAETWSRMVAGTRWLFRGSFVGVVEIDGDVATGRWPCVETGEFADGRGYDNRAFYADRYVRVEGRWLFQSRHYTYLWLSNEQLPGAPIPLEAEESRGKIN